MIKSRKKIIITLILCVMFLIIIIAFLAPNIIHFINNLYDDSWKSRYYKEYPTVNGLVIQPDSYNYFYIKYPTARLYIEIDKGNISELQPMVLNNSSFSLYQQGKSFQPSIETYNIEKDLTSGRFVYNNSIGMDHYLLIKNNDINNTANVTIKMFVPMG